MEKNNIAIKLIKGLCRYFKPVDMRTSGQNLLANSAQVQFKFNFPAPFLFNSIRSWEATLIILTYQQNHFRK